MKFKQIPAEVALDRFVMEYINRFEQIHYRVNCIQNIDPETGDEYITVFDPQTDQCLTLWYSPAWYGSKMLKEAKAVISGIMEGGEDGS